MNIKQLGIMERIFRYLFLAGLVYFGVNFKYIFLGITVYILFMVYIKLKYKEVKRFYKMHNKTYILVAFITTMFFEIFLNGQYLENQTNILYAIVVLGFISEIFIFTTSDFH